MRDLCMWRINSEKGGNEEKYHMMNMNYIESHHKILQSRHSLVPVMDQHKQNPFVYN